MPGQIPIYDFPILLEGTQGEKQEEPMDNGHLCSGNTSVLLQAQGEAQAGGLAGGHNLLSFFTLQGSCQVKWQEWTSSYDFLFSNI